MIDRMLIHRPCFPVNIERSLTITCSVLKNQKTFILWQEIRCLIGSPSGEPMFHFAGSGENLPDIAKSRDASMRMNLAEQLPVSSHKLPFFS